MANSKYENQSQQLYINTESGFGSIGDQINRWKVDLNTSPFQNEDNTILRLNLTNFSMTKNWYNINETNNAVRMCWEGYTDPTSQKVVSDVDTILRIPPGDYTTHAALIAAFITVVKAAMDAAVAGTTFTAVVFRPPQTVRNKPSVYDGNDPSHFDSAGPRDLPVDYRWLMQLTASIAGFRYVKLPRFQCLSVSTTEALNLNGVATALDSTEFYSDSYILLGGIRIEEFKDFDDANLLQSFSVKNNNQVLRIGNWFPMNNSLNTSPHIYLRSRSSRTQASSNLEEAQNPHNHNMINSSLFAKIPRVIQDDGSVHYVLENSPYFTNVTSHNLNSIEFELTDSKGRNLPQSSIGTTFSGNVESEYLEDPPTGTSIARDGNMFCDMVLLVEKFAFNNPNALVGFGSAPRPLDTNRFAQNPNLTINSSRCG